jgi:hypothetical protein
MRHATFEMCVKNLYMMGPSSRDIRTLTGIVAPLLKRQIVEMAVPRAGYFAKHLKKFLRKFLREQRLTNGRCKQEFLFLAGLTS